LKEGFNERVSERKELEVVQKKFEEKFNLRKDKIKSNMVEYIKNTKDERRREEEMQREQVNEFYERVETVEIFERYEKGIRQYYKFYAA